MAANPGFGIGMWALVILFFFGSPLNLPLSLPPLPEDPTLAQIAPEDCVWYVAFSGMDKANPKSGNQAEQLLAETEVRQFAGEIVSKLKAAAIGNAGNHPTEQLLAEEVPKLVELLLTRPLCAYVRTEPGGAGLGPQLRGGVVVNLGEQTDSVKAALEKMESVLLAEIQPADLPIDGWHKLPAPPGVPPVEWGIKGNYLIVGIGPDEAAALNERRGKAPPAWYAQFRKQVAVERPAVVHYLNVKFLMDLLIQFSRGDIAVGDQDQVVVLHIQAIQTMLGLQNVTHVGTVNGLEKEGFVSRTIIATDGALSGLLSLASAPPLKLDSLATIPADSTFAVAARLNLNKAMETMLDALANVAPGARAANEQQLADMARETGVHIKDDLLASLGDTWTVYNSPSDGGLVITGLTAMATIEDRAKLAAANSKLIAFVKRQMEAPAEQEDVAGNRRPRGVFVEETEFAGHKIHFLNFVGVESIIAPAWCIDDKHLVFSLFPQTIKAHLARDTESAAGAKSPSSLSKVPAVAQQFSGDKGPTMLTYQDTPSLFKLAYPLLQVFSQTGFAELQREGIDLNISILPSVQAILPHLMPNISTVRVVKDGILIESRGTLPVGAGTLPLVMAPVLGMRAIDVRGLAEPLAVMLPGGRAAANQKRSITNLKMIGLAMHNFHSVTRSFPSATGAHRTEKPSLSWRVHVLPYLEQQPLYDQFHLDEPWDSEHNKKLIEKMPDVYKAPGSKAAAKFKTVYLTPRGENTAFPGDESINMRNITDGTSKTIMVVEASDDKAVVWTKPDDFEVNEKNPIVGLVGLRDGSFLAALCDGSVRPIPAKIARETLNALFTRAGGEVVQPF